MGDGFCGKLIAIEGNGIFILGGGERAAGVNIAMGLSALTDKVMLNVLVILAKKNIRRGDVNFCCTGCPTVDVMVNTRFVFCWIIMSVFAIMDEYGGTL